MNCSSFSLTLPTTLMHTFGQYKKSVHLHEGCLSFTYTYLHACTYEKREKMSKEHLCEKYYTLQAVISLENQVSS